MKRHSLMCLSIAAVAMISVSILTSCDDSNIPDTATVVEEASQMTLAELEAKAQEEMEASNDTFKVVALTSTMESALELFGKTYDWLPDDDSWYNCNNSYKDAALFTALEQADTSYFADFALVQDARNLANCLESGILHNYVPSDYASLGLAKEDTMPLKGIHFNKIFFVNNTYDLYTEHKFYNIWQVAGSESDEGHLSKLSFQNPTTEQINMSFLLSLMSPSNEAMLKEAYKEYYDKDWAASSEYSTIGEEYVYTFLDNVATYHESDGTTMKETQYKEGEMDEHWVYFGAYSKMKDAAKTEDGKPMKTVGWDLELEGFNSFMYTMYSQVVNNAKHPYTACLFARFILTPDCYKAMCYNEVTPNSKGEASNQYGYYYPCTNADGVGVNDLDWTKDEWMSKSVVEDYNYLKDVKSTVVEDIKAHIAK